MRRAIRAGALCALAAVAGCPKARAPAPPSWWHVDGGALRDDAGRAVILRGVNVSSKHKQKPYFDFHQAPDFARIRGDWGMNSVRLLVSWAAVEPQPGAYDAAYLDAVAERVGWAQDADLLVVLDMHQDLFGEGFTGGDGAPRWTCDDAEYAAFTPQDPWFFGYLQPGVVACYDRLYGDANLRAHYAEAWRRIADRVKGYPNVVGFDPMNEPYWGSAPLASFEADVLSPFYEQVVPAARSAAPHLVAFLEPSSSRNLGTPTSLARPSFGDVVYAPHSYDRDAESGKGFDPSHRDAIVSNLASLADEAKALGAALWVGEYGGDPDQPGIDPYMTAQYDGIGAVAAGSAYWDYEKGGGYGMLADDGSERTALVDVLVRPYPERVAGTPARWAWDAATSTFTLEYHADGAIAAPTILSVPARRYPNGYAVDCGGCAYAKSGGALTLTSPPPGDPARVTLHP